MNNFANQTPYLRVSRDFPLGSKDLSDTCSKSYIDIATAVNARTIGIFTTTRPVVTGESWFILKNKRQQTIRQVYNITSYAAIDHGINLSSLSTFTVIRAIGYDGTNYFPIPFINGAASNVGIYVNATQILFTPVGAPALVSGVVILEWLSST